MKNYEVGNFDLVKSCVHEALLNCLGEWKEASSNSALPKACVDWKKQELDNLTREYGRMCEFEERLSEYESIINTGRIETQSIKKDDGDYNITMGLDRIYNEF